VFKLFVGIVIGLALVAAGWWYYSDGGRRDPVEGLQDAVSHQGRKAVDAVGRKIGEGVHDLKESIDETGARLSQETKDAALLARVKTALIREKSFDGFDIDVDVENGVVSLTGTVPSLEGRALAIKLARETEGVKSIRADLKLKYSDPE
jgi:osmotically-inducible protein OsmY